MNATSTPFSLRYGWARGLFESGDHLAAASAFAELLAEAEAAATDDTQPFLHSTTDLREFLARAYFHSAQFRKAEAVLRGLIEESPTDGYAHLLLGRTLQRAGRHAEAARPLALAEILGDYERPQAYGGPAE
ncbi:tetratricopeptide repeat protein [Intrasporangium calvum]|uniref:Tetratricopeptide repeat protein n=1 Tax=Intrasporangium calvum TaxID=53358 RepID=A0ABT5GDW8_9MICO|nr:tetratricopeptide repeat protein [Intrasporangium calvum]MDC5696324.1 tetratricopeptide repeat protein [Intrasporangium calvum]